MRVAILTSDDIRHRYFVNALRRAVPVVAVCYQDTGYHPAAAAQRVLDRRSEPVEAGPRAAGSARAEPAIVEPAPSDAADCVRRHFEERTRQERAFFGHDAAFVEDGPDCRVFTATAATLNTAETLERLRQARADTVVVYGTSLIRPLLIDAFPGRMINMHLGLSPYYRGTATNFYPLVNDEPEYVGVTIHHIDPGIDSGAIIHQDRPDITAEDMPHTVGCKAILVGIELMIRALRELDEGWLRSVPQWHVPNARLYLRRHYHPSQVVRLYELIREGLFPRYAARKHVVEPRVRLVE